MKKIIGYMLMVSPLMVITGFMVNEIGITRSLVIWGGIFLTLAVIVAGTWLIND